MSPTFPSGICVFCLLSLRGPEEAEAIYLLAKEEIASSLRFSQDR
jgi:hypothetical protein